MANTNIGQVHVVDDCIVFWYRERRPDAQPAIWSPYLGVSYLDVVSHVGGGDNERRRMIFFTIALSILIFSDTTDVTALIGIAPTWALVVILTTWLVLGVNNWHVSDVAKAATKPCKLMKQVVTIQRR
jgi:hypothetical protein